MAVPKYMSEEFWVGSRCYMVEVKQKKDGGEKYMIIKESGAEDDRQHPVIVFPRQMQHFMRMMDRAFEAVLHDVEPIEGEVLARREQKRAAKKKAVSQKAAGKKLTKKKPAVKRVKANPPEFCNAGKPWTAGADKLLTEHFHQGTDMETMKKLFKRREGSITVRMYKLGLLPSNE